VLHPAGFNLAKSTLVFLTKPQPVGASSEKLKLTWRQVDLGELPTGLFFVYSRGVRVRLKLSVTHKTLHFLLHFSDVTPGFSVFSGLKSTVLHFLLQKCNKNVTL